MDERQRRYLRKYDQKMPRVTIRLSATTFERLAALPGKSVPDTIRRIIEAYLDLVALPIDTKK